MSERSFRLKVGDTVTIAARIVYGDDRARMMATHATAGAVWHSIRVDGTVVSKAAHGRWNVKFGDDVPPASWARSLLEFKFRPPSLAERGPLSPGEAQTTASPQATEDTLGEDSDDAASMASDAGLAADMVQEPTDEEIAAPTEEVSGWTRDDSPNISQRAKDLAGNERKYKHDDVNTNMSKYKRE